MLESLLRRGVLPLALALCLAPLATAGASVDEKVDYVADEASNLHPWAEWAVDRARHGEGSGSSSDDDESSQGSSGGGSSGGSNPLAAGRPVVIVILQTADGVLDSLDPLGLVEEVQNQATPVKEAAEALPTILLPADEGEVSEPAPASASAAEVEPDSTVPLLVASATAAAAAAVAALWLAGSSGSLGAGAAGATGSAGKFAGTDLRRLLPFASPLFTRFEKDTVLGHPKREALYALILQDPGVSLQSLCDSTGLSRTAVTHHLRLMELQHLIVSKRMGRSRHYYENGGRFGRDQKDAYAVLQNDRSKEVADFVKQNPGAIQKAICAAVGVQASVAHWHLKRLQDALLVEAVRHGRTVSYFPGAGLKGMSSLPAIVPTPAPMQATPVPFTV